MSRPSPVPAGHNLFVYGSLLFDEIVAALTDHTFSNVPAMLKGFSRHAIVRRRTPEPYPAIRPDDSGVVNGRLLLDVDSVSIRWIDRFEADPPDYARWPVQVQSVDGIIHPATAYVARSSLIPLLKGHWDPAEFQRVHLRDYVDRLIPDLRGIPSKESA